MHKLDIGAKGTHFVVYLDNDKVLDGADAAYKRGYIGLQFHKDSKIEFRNIKIRPIAK